ncbi:nitroreductase [Anaerotruncus sp. X29]|nr:MULTISPECIES: nitroreductase family protein [unclassified Anaerotruncus]NBK19328.1 nitroreductase family protein [Anaerotruncus sp. 1XD42-93]NCE75772.1 nitroreductase [Anaerotruncus sp. X29]RKJ81613.1 nitroreductase family protein [Anaerotruncus sp. 1XD22-93]
MPAITDRRSIRKYRDTPVKRQMVEEILRAGMLAPSSKNRQPWRFIVAEGRAKAQSLAAMERGLEREKKQPLLPQSAQHLEAARHTLRIMEQAPVVIFVVNPLGIGMNRSLTVEERVYELCNAQSIGAALENMSLTAFDLGLGSLWICDTYFAQEELMGWLGAEGELAAAMAVGYAAESPQARPRKKLEDAVEWRI